MIKEIKARITVFLDDGSETDLVFSADNWKHLIADIDRFSDSEDEKEKNFIRNTEDAVDEAIK